MGKDVFLLVALPCSLLFMMVLLMAIMGGLWLLVQRHNQRWKDLSQALNLPLASAGLFHPPKMNGVHQGYALEVSQGREPGSRSGCTLVIVSLRSPMNLGLRVYRESVLTRVDKIMGVEDLQVGDEVFDRRFVIQAHDVEGAMRFLTPRVRAALLRCDQACPAQLQDGVVLWKGNGGNHSVEKIVKIVEHLLWLAQEIDGQASSEDASSSG